MQPILTVVEQAKKLFRHKLEQVEAAGGLTLEQYVRYLSMQFHLTKDVQRHFFMAASHSSLATKGRLREFLVAFGLEEEMHYRIAKRDLENLGQPLLPAPLDVKLWWAYFDAVLHSRPFVRLGATCILENLGSGSSDVAKRLLGQAPFITDRTARFMQIHMHEELPHGDWILQVLKDTDLDEANLADLTEGAKIGAILYLRMVDWALQTDSLMCSFSDSIAQLAVPSAQSVA
jgi:Iron-containing redox enzyme